MKARVDIGVDLVLQAHTDRDAMNRGHGNASQTEDRRAVVINTIF